MSAELWRSGVEVAAWGVALAWCVRTTDALRNLPLLPNLAEAEWDVEPEGLPSLTVIVPARDEAEKIAATLDALVQGDYAGMRVMAVDDRSSDRTGTIMDRYARDHPERVSVLHITELPPGWLGKTHAMAEAVAASDSEYVLFTDADVLFSPSVLRRSLAYAQSDRVDHLVTCPTMQVKSWGEGVLLAFFQVLGFWASRPWRVADPKSQRDFVGVGSFNLLRREALAELGGLEPQRLAVLEDMVIARRVKSAGMRQRIAFAPGMVLVHWAAGAGGIIRVMSKNLFSAFNFRPLLAVGACVWIVLFCLAPLAGLAWWGTLVPGLLVVTCVSTVCRIYNDLTKLGGKYGWGFPLGAVAFIYALARSMVVVWKDGGVMWRGTLYPLRELRLHNSLLGWRARGARPDGKRFR